MLLQISARVAPDSTGLPISSVLVAAEAIWKSGANTEFCDHVAEEEFRHAGNGRCCRGRRIVS